MVNSPSFKAHRWSVGSGQAWGLWLAAVIPFGLSFSAPASDWPQWLGPERDGHAPVGDFVPRRLPAEANPTWRIRIGGGFSSPVITGQKLIYLDTMAQKETAHCVDARDGRELWKVDYDEAFEDEWGKGPRATPVIDGDRVYIQSCKGEFRCLNVADGKTVWRKNFEKDFGAVFFGKVGPEFAAARRRGNNGSAVISGDRIILPVGATNQTSLLCCDKRTGAVIWKSQDDEMAYSSLQVATLAGIPQVVAFTAEALIGVRLSDGKLLWRWPLQTNARRHASTPVISGNSVTVNSHTFGMVCLDIVANSGGCEAKQKWLNRELKINLATPVLVEAHLYAHGPAKNFICVDFATGKLKWAQPGFGKDYSSTMAAGPNLLVLTDDGQLVLAAADPEEYRELGRLQVCGKNWNYPAYVGGKLYVRDYHELLCLDLAGAGAK